MTDFNAGDRVEYTGTLVSSLIGLTGVITGFSRNGFALVDFDNGPLDTKCDPSNLTKLGDEPKLELDGYTLTDIAQIGRDCLARLDALHIGKGKRAGDACLHFFVGAAAGAGAAGKSNLKEHLFRLVFIISVRGREEVEEIAKLDQPKQEEAA